MPKILRRKLSHTATKPRNLQTFSAIRHIIESVSHSQLRCVPYCKSAKYNLAHTDGQGMYEGVTCKQVQFTSMQSRNQGGGGYLVQALKFSVHTIADLATRVYKFVPYTI